MGDSSRVSLLIPWRPGCPHREAALGWVLDRWRSTGYEPLLGQPPAGSWCKAEAVAAAMPRAAGGVLVVADADVWTEGIGEAIDMVAGGVPWAIPHGPVHRLTRAATDTVLASGLLGGELEQPPYRGFEGGGVTIIRREVYVEAPLDRRFAGWGQEDEAWALALRTLAGPPWRGAAPLWHLWHPPQARESRRWGSGSSRALYRRYRRAAGRPDEMRALLDEMEVP